MKLVKLSEIEKQIIVPVEVPIPVDRVIEKSCSLLKEMLKRLFNAHKQLKRLLKLKLKVLKLKHLLKRYQFQLLNNKLDKLKKLFLMFKQKLKKSNFSKKKLFLNNVEVEKIVPVDRFIEKL
jgi:hypothetical protein